jgi:predicted nicotinamide N-methyase
MEHDPKQFASDSLQGKRILELGSGCGLAGIAMMMKGADMTMTDLPQVVESLTSVNASTLYGQLSTKGSGSFPNPLKPPHIVSLDWNDYERLSNPSSGLSAPYDIVLLTDCVFSASLAPALIGVIKFACGPRSVVYCCHEIRDEVRMSINNQTFIFLGDFLIRISSLLIQYRRKLMQYS